MMLSKLKQGSHRNRKRSRLRMETLEPRRLLAVTTAVNSGNWDDANTWDNGVPDQTSRAIVQAGKTVTLTGVNHVADEIVIHGVLRVQESAQANAPTKTLTADWIHVNSGGLFRVGTASNPFDKHDFVLTLTGTDPNANHVVETATGSMNVNNNNGFLMTASGGRLQFFGEEKLSFTKLAATADVGATTITVENVIERNFDGTTSAASDGVLDWEVGDEIVIASSSYDYTDEEVRTINGVSVQGDQTVLTLNAPLAHRHYGQIESYSNPSRTFDIDLRAEVALLNRSITIQGTQDTDNSFGDRANYGTGAGENVGIGAHTMVMSGSGQITVDGVRFDKMGQTGRLGRYPMHWHVAGDRDGDVMRNSSVTNSNNRGVTVHGTQNVLLENNVLHDIHGHGFFMEDAAETGNEFLSNIVLGIHKVGGLFKNDPFIVPGITRGPDGKVNGEAPRNENGESSHDTGQNFTPRFLHSASYWITNPDNTWIGNVSAGSEGSGFWFALPDEVLGLSKDTGLYNSLNPVQTNLRQFDNNTTHSAPVGLTFDRGADLLPGSSNNYAPPSLMRVKGLTAYKHDGSAVYHRGSVGLFQESRFADNDNSSFNTFRQEEHDVLFVGHSRGNAELSNSVGGFRLYDGPGRIVDSHFAGFSADNAHMFRIEGGANKHSHTRAEGITFEDDGSADHLSIEFQEKDTIVNDSSPVFVSGRPDGFSGLVLDVDGSLTGHAGGGVNHVLTPRLDFYRDSTDIAPQGWNAYISDDRFGQLKIGTINDVGQIPEYRIENGDGHAVLVNRWNLDYVQRQYAKFGAGDYTVTFQNPLPSTGFDVYLEAKTDGLSGDATVFRLVDVAAGFKPSTGTSVNSLTALRQSGQNAYLRDYAGDLWMKVFNADATIEVVPTSAPLPSNPQIAFVASTLSNGSRIEAEEFDRGGQGFASWDTTAGNAGGAFRANQSVDIQATSDDGGGFGVGWTADGEFLEYTTDIVGGIYDIEFRAASAGANAKSIRILVGDGDAAETFTELGVIEVPDTGGNQSWQTLTLQDADLTSWQGSDRVIRLEIIGGSFNLNWFQFNSALDFGDAPAPYPTQNAVDGARHIATGPSLGTNRDTEADGVPSADSDADDLTGTVDDEDGVLFGGIGVASSTAALNVLLDNAAEAKVDAWIDFNRNGVWEPSEKILNSVTVDQPMQTLNYNLPAGLVPGDTYARVRISSGGGLLPTGLATDGEVEDYKVSIASPPIVESIVINGGDPQRSSLTKAKLTFDRVVDIDGTLGDPFQFVHQTSGAAVTDIPVIDHSSGKTVVDFTFDPGGLSVTHFGSLQDGDYRLTINPAWVTYLGVELDGDANGVAGGDYVMDAVDGFFRKYGDSSGDGSVGLADFAAFRSSFGQSLGDPSYQDGFDSDGDNSIGLADFAAFRANFGS
jgi:hypothetical protein